MFYLVRTPSWLQKLFPKYIWEKPTEEKLIYLTFDDGPHPEHSVFVLDELKKVNAKATFFCIGKNVQLYPEIYKRIIEEGHSVGNHTQNHVRGRATKDKEYIENVKLAANIIDSNLFRPPYGSIKRFQAKLLMEMARPFKIVMWTVLSADFDTTITKERCLENVIFKTKPGSIVLFHDSEKASERMKFALPKFINSFTEKGFRFCKL
jgi:peptidoglycan-N-acetylglucosamine deacetylase